MRPTLRVLGLAALIAAGAGSGAEAGDRYGPGFRSHGLYHGGHGYAGDYGYGYAGSAIGGDYVGAPFTRFPRPNEIVPPAWGYGTYGVPTVTGIRQAPTAQPTLTVIDAATPRRGQGPRLLSRGAGQGWDDGGTGLGNGVRVISVTVPRR